MMSSAQIQKRIKAGLKRAQAKTGSPTADKVYHVSEVNTGGNTPVDPPVITKTETELPNAIFIDFDAKMFSATILAGDRQLICDNAKVIVQGDKIRQGSINYIVVSNEPIAPTSDVLAYIPQLRIQ